MYLSVFDQVALKGIVTNFPNIFDRAVEDFARFKVGQDAHLFTDGEVREVVDWYTELPELWEKIRINWVEGRVPEKLEFSGRVDDFIGKLRRYPPVAQGLGVPVAVIAGVLIVGGVAAALWAVNYIKRQQNISRIINGVVAGKISESTLAEAIKAEQGTGLFAGVKDIGKLLLFGGLAAAAVALFGVRRR